MRIIAAILVLLALAGWVVWQAVQPQQAAQAMPEWQSPLLADVQLVTITGPGMTAVQLVRHGDGWQLNGEMAADGTAVRHLLDDLQQMRPIRMVTSGHAHDAELELGNRAVVVKLEGEKGAVIDAFEVGKQGTDLISTYVRRPGASAVMAMDRALLWQVKRLPKAWQAASATEREAQPANKGQ